MQEEPTDTGSIRSLPRRSLIRSFATSTIRGAAAAWPRLARCLSLAGYPSPWPQRLTHGRQGRLARLFEGLARTGWLIHDAAGASAAPRVAAARQACKPIAASTTKPA